MYVVGAISLSSLFFFSSRRRHTRCSRDWSSDVCSSDLSDSDPLPELGIRLEACRVHQDPSLHRPPRQVEETSMTVSQRLIRCFWRQADDHLGAVDAAAHVSVEEERDPPEHLLLLQPFALSKGETNSPRQLLVECHRVRLGLGALEMAAPPNGSRLS